MKKIVCFGLCFMIVLCSFVLCFADGGSPVILPVSEDGSIGLNVTYSNGQIRTYSANTSPVYFCFATINGSRRIFVFSDSPDSIVYYNNNGSIANWALTSEYNGYFYAVSSSLPIEDSSYYIGSFATNNELIDFVDSSVFSTTFDLTYLINGSVSWLSSFAQVVKNNGLLLFFVLTVFVGVGLGLFNRFRRD